MTLREGFYTWLNAQGFVTSGRVYANGYPQNPPGFPLIRINKQGEVPDQTLAGGKEFTEQTFQLDVFATTYLSASTTIEAVKTALIDFAGDMGTVEVQDTRLDSETEFYEDDLKLHVISIDVTMWSNA